jgi:hypothetical protein
LDFAKTMKGLYLSWATKVAFEELIGKLKLGITSVWFTKSQLTQIN